MVCSACQDKPTGKPCGACGKLPPVLEIHSEECPILFHTVELESAYDDDPPYIGRYKNVLCVYQADDSWVLYNSDGIYSVFGANLNFDALIGRPKYAGMEMTSTTDIPDVVATVAGEAEVRAAADTALDDRLKVVERDLPLEVTARGDADAVLQGQITGLDTAINKNVVTDMTVDPDMSSTVQLDLTKTNIKTGTSTVSNVALPVASSLQSGIINPATFDTISSSASNINALLNGAVAVTGISASPTQADITTAWQTATGLTTLINRASVLDVDNSKIWTYYTNDTTWHESNTSAPVVINTFTNSSEGTIKGSTANGKVYAESDGTGSINGWDSLVNEAADATSKLGTIEQGAQVNVQADWSEADNTADSYIQNKPTDLSDFSNTTGFIQVVASTTDIGENADLAANTLYVVYS